MPDLRYLSVSGSFIGIIAYPVDVVTCGPKQATVSLRVKSKLPNRGWLPKGTRVRVPADCLCRRDQIVGAYLDRGNGRLEVVRA